MQTLRYDISGRPPRQAGVVHLYDDNGLEAARLASDLMFREWTEVHIRDTQRHTVEQPEPTDWRGVRKALRERTPPTRVDCIDCDYIG